MHATIDAVLIIILCTAAQQPDTICLTGAFVFYKGGSGDVCWAFNQAVSGLYACCVAGLLRGPCTGRSCCLVGATAIGCNPDFLVNAAIAKGLI